MTHGISNGQYGVLKAGAIDLEHELEQVNDLPTSSDLPLTLASNSQPRETENGEPVLIGTVDEPIPGLGVGSDPGVALDGEMVVTTFQICKPIVMKPDRLLHLDKFGVCLI